jgi:hypothetical protein
MRGPFWEKGPLKLPPKPYVGAGLVETIHELSLRLPRATITPRRDRSYGKGEGGLRETPPMENTNEILRHAISVTQHDRQPV